MSREIERQNGYLTVKIAYVNLAAQHAPIKGELLEAIAGVIDRGQFILGEEVHTFEQRFAESCGVPFAVAVNSGTDALILALRALGIGQGDEVIITGFTCSAVPEPILFLGARPATPSRRTWRGWPATRRSRCRSCSRSTRRRRTTTREGARGRSTPNRGR